MPGEDAASAGAVDLRDAGAAVLAGGVLAGEAGAVFEGTGAGDATDGVAGVFGVGSGGVDVGTVEATVDGEGRGLGKGGSGAVGTGTVAVGTGTVGVGTGTVGGAGTDGGPAMAAATAASDAATVVAATASNRFTHGQRAGRRNGCCPERAVKHRAMDWKDDEPPESEGLQAGWELRMETCRILLWRGYLTSVFYARRTGDVPGTSIEEQSSPFRWRRPSPPDTEEAHRAHDELMSRLKDSGWTQTGRGDAWYEAELARPQLVPSVQEREPVPVLEPAPVVVPPTSLQPAPREPRAAAPARAPAPAASTETTVPGHDRWRLAAAAGLVTAVALLSWVATHPSTGGASSPLSPALAAPQATDTAAAPNQ